MNQKETKSGFILTSLLFASLLAFSQNKISGTVTDENGNALERATLQIKGTSVSTIADAKGRYTLSSEQKLPWTVLVSNAGYLVKEFEVSKQGVYNFSLTEFVSLSGVTIVGTRGKPRTDVKRPVPVDIFSAKELQNTGQIELGQQLQFASPSYNSAKYGIN